MDEQPIAAISEHLTFANDFVAVYNDDVVFRRSGRIGTHVRIVERNGDPGVVALPLCKGEFGLVRTYRYPLKRWQWGFPRGFAHSRDSESSARREVFEELGAYPDDLEPLGVVTPNSGLLTSEVHVFLARFRDPPMGPQDTDEVAEVRWVLTQQLLDEVRGGSIGDGLTLAALMLWSVSGLR